jgi:hypothetical protein
VRKRKRVLLWAGILVAPAGMGIAMRAGAIRSDHRINHENYDAIGPSMGVQDVEKLLGGRAGDYTLGQYTGGVIGGGDWKTYVSALDWRPPWAPPKAPVPEEEGSNFGDFRVWTGSQGEVRVCCDDLGKVCWEGFAPVAPTDQTILDRFRHWLGL